MHKSEQGGATKREGERIREHLRDTTRGFLCMPLTTRFSYNYLTPHKYLDNTIRENVQLGRRGREQERIIEE